MSVYLPLGLDYLAGVVAQAAPDPITGWASLGVSGLFVAAWWIERKDRKEADQRLREAFERVYSVVTTLEHAVEIVERAGKGQ